MDYRVDELCSRVLVHTTRNQGPSRSMFTVRPNLRLKTEHPLKGRVEKASLCNAFCQQGM